MFRTLRPQNSISEESLNTSLRNLLFDGVCSQIMGGLTGGAFLAGFALSLGASGKVIGMIWQRSVRNVLIIHTFVHFMKDFR